MTQKSPWNVLLLIAFGSAMSCSLACAGMPVANARPTGENLRIEYEIADWGIRPHSTLQTTLNSSVDIANALNFDMESPPVRVTQYTTTPREEGKEPSSRPRGRYNVVRWQAFQGKAPINDQALFHIAGDTKAAQFVDTYYRTGLLWNRFGSFLIPAGLMTMIIGPLVYSALLPKYRGGAGPPLIALTGLVVSLPIGIPLTLNGFLRTKNTHPLNDPGRANRAAARYNIRPVEQPVNGGPEN